MKVFSAKFVPKFTKRESFCQKFRVFFGTQKFLPLKYPNFFIPTTDTKDLFGVGEVHVLRLKSIRGLLSKSDFWKSTNIEAYVSKF